MIGKDLEWLAEREPVVRDRRLKSLVTLARRCIDDCERLHAELGGRRGSSAAVPAGTLPLDVADQIEWDAAVAAARRLDVARLGDRIRLPVGTIAAVAGAIDRLARERGALLALAVQPWCDGWEARLPWRTEGYDGGTPDPDLGPGDGLGIYSFQTPEQAEAAVLTAAGIGEDASDAESA